MEEPFCGDPFRFFRPAFDTDGLVVPQFLQLLKDTGVVDLAGTRLSTPRRVSDLDVADLLG